MVNKIIPPTDKMTLKQFQQSDGIRVWYAEHPKSLAIGPTLEKAVKLLNDFVENERHQLALMDAEGKVIDYKNSPYMVARWLDKDKPETWPVDIEINKN